MPWNDNSTPGPKPGPKSSSGKGPKPGPWGAPNGDKGSSDPPPPRDPPRRPTGGGGGNGGGTPPDFNQIGRKLADQAKRYFNNGPGGPGTGGGSGGFGGRDGAGLKVAAAIGAGIIGLWLVSGTYQVGANQRAVITTFGAYSGQAGPGLNYRLPWPIQDVQKVTFTTLNNTPVGGDDATPQLDESLMLTGDQNIVDLKFTVQWRVADAYRFTFNVKNTQDMIKAVAESAMREVVGRTNLQTIITTGQGDVQTQTAQLMQHILDSYNAGVYVDEVQIRSANPPPKVLDAFREVAAAKQKADSVVNKAEGEAAQIKQQALGYKAQTVQEAEGESARFNQVYEQYKLAPAVTKQRLYTETMEKVLQKSNNIVVDSKATNLPLVLSPDTLRSRGSDAVITVSPPGGR